MDTVLEIRIHDVAIGLSYYWNMHGLSCAHAQVLGSSGGGAGQAGGGDDDRALMRLLLQGTLDTGGDGNVHWEAFFHWYQRWGWEPCSRTELLGGRNHLLPMVESTCPVC